MIRRFLMAFAVLVMLSIGLVFVKGATEPQDAEPASVSSNHYASESVSKHSSTAALTGAVLTVSALKLFMDYHQNEVAADTIYRNRRLRVRGMVVQIRKNFLDEAVLELATTNEFEHVSASLAESQEARAASLQKYTAITVLCEGNGMSIGSPMLKNCQIIDEDDLAKANLVDQLPAPLAPLATPDENGVYSFGRGLAPPTLVFAPDPEYSEEAKQKNVGGTVTVSLVVDADGTSQNVRVLRPIGAGLDEKAIESVSHYRFKPAMFQGQPVPIALSINVEFQSQ